MILYVGEKSTMFIIHDVMYTPGLTFFNSQLLTYPKNAGNISMWIHHSASNLRITLVFFCLFLHHRAPLKSTQLHPSPCEVYVPFAQTQKLEDLISCAPPPFTPAFLRPLPLLHPRCWHACDQWHPGWLGTLKRWGSASPGCCSPELPHYPGGKANPKNSSCHDLV